MDHLKKILLILGNQSLAAGSRLKHNQKVPPGSQFNVIKASKFNLCQFNVIKTSEQHEVEPKHFHWRGTMTKYSPNQEQYFSETITFEERKTAKIQNTK